MDVDTKRVHPERTRLLSPLVVGLIALSLMSYIALNLVAGSDWNPTVFIKFPQANNSVRAYAEERFDEIVPAGNEGHDGKYFFIQASDPFYLNPDQHAHLLGRPTYRAQRMLYPTIAGGLGAFSPELTAWSMVVLNVLAVGVGTVVTSKVAVSVGLSPLLGLAFLVNPAVFVSSLIDTAEVFAMAFLMGAILMVLKRRPLAAAMLFTASVLSRETMLLSVMGWVVFELAHHRRWRWEMLLPFLSAGAWWLYLRTRIGHLAPEVQDVRALGKPLQGFLASFDRWSSQAGQTDDFIIAILLASICVLFAYLAVTRRSLIPLMGAGFGVVALLMVDEVWLSYFDSSRALTPLITLFFLAVPFALRPHSGGVV